MIHKNNTGVSRCHPEQSEGSQRDSSAFSLRMTSNSIYPNIDVHRNGYIAIVSILVIGVIVFAIGMSVSLLSISEGQLSLSGESNERTLHLTEGCAEDALIRLNKTHTLPASIVLPEGTCTITINSHVGNNWTFTTTGILNTLTKRIQISATRTSKVSVTSWLEI